MGCLSDSIALGSNPDGVGVQRLPLIIHEPDPTGLDVHLHFRARLEARQRSSIVDDGVAGIFGNGSERNLKYRQTQKQGCGI